MKRILIIGIGNPGHQYRNNRHNAGSLLVNYSFSDASVVLELENDYNCRIDILMCCSYVNTTGDIINTHNADIVINVVDDMETDLGKIKFVYPTQGHKGHNGTRNIMKYLGNRFCSVRIGVGRPVGLSVHEFVLSDFKPNEKEIILSLKKFLLDGLKEFLKKISSPSISFTQKF
jgi:PTH1 family peptidyl-tRNA hydrolase